MGRFMTTRGQSKFVYTPLHNPKTNKIYAWQQKSMKTGKKERISWDRAKEIFMDAKTKEVIKFVRKSRGLDYQSAKTLVVQARNRYWRFGKQMPNLY